MAGRQHLRDHAAHRRADDMGALDAEVVQQALHVVGHVDQRVGHLAAAARHVAQHPRVDRAVGLLAVQLRRQAGVAVVEADDAVALFDQLRAEPVRPHRQLGADAHDQQHGRGVGVAEILVEQLHVAAERRRRCGFASHISTAGSASMA